MKAYVNRISIGLSQRYSVLAFTTSTIDLTPIPRATKSLSLLP